MQNALPELMVAPNGARRTKEDHPALPITISEIVSTARACNLAGADGIHIHVRDAKGGHILDAGIYREVLRELEIAVPAMQLQITTEAVGKYSAQEQRQLVKDVRPKSVSVSIAEMFLDGNVKDALNFYRWCHDENIAVQHILYGPDDLALMDNRLGITEFTEKHQQMLFVLGRYTKNQQSQPEDLTPFMSWLSGNQWQADWAVCAFGKGETDCSCHAYNLGGKVRIGFENSIWHKNGSIAEDNAARIKEFLTERGTPDER
ncbi:3-keto-5-aminohexanoate cleavage protein [Ahrensia marina]|uniref:Class III aminotransferase n=1 Tax=Ahrensia marina TaxID=1514904 RepID=A0A0N0VMI5_9HYPH|nr:3-keto-5-aminohexanoate cleavage protein [Ahrensia marina]KPB02598.1 class III aminotransferase [Ahrensia marina]